MDRLQGQGQARRDRIGRAKTGKDRLFRLRETSSRGWWRGAGGPCLNHAAPAMPENSTAKNLRPYVTGGSAACWASFCIHPIDVTKVRLQVVPPPATAFSVAKEILASDGVKGLYAG